MAWGMDIGLDIDIDIGIDIVIDIGIGMNYGCKVYKIKLYINYTHSH